MPSSTLQLLASLPPTNPSKTLEDAHFPKSLFSLLLQPTAKRFLTQRSRLAIRAEAKLRSSQFSKVSALPDAKRRKEIVLFDAAPPLSEESGGGGGRIVGGGRVPDEKRKNGGLDLLFLLKKLPKRVLATLSNLPLAIGEMFTIATLMALATVIDQGEAPDFYFQKFPEENPLFGFVTWRWVLSFGFDHMFTSPIFLGMLVLLAASLISCTYTTQIPMVKIARRWSFVHSAEAIQKQEFSDSLPHASIQDLGVILMGSGYEWQDPDAIVIPFMDKA